jgi:hypothetical protein
MMKGVGLMLMVVSWSMLGQRFQFFIQYLSNIPGITAKHHPSWKHFWKPPLSSVQAQLCTISQHASSCAEDYDIHPAHQFNSCAHKTVCMSSRRLPWFLPPIRNKMQQRHPCNLQYYDNLCPSWWLLSLPKESAWRIPYMCIVAT